MSESKTIQNEAINILLQKYNSNPEYKATYEELLQTVGGVHSIDQHQREANQYTVRIENNLVSVTQSPDSMPFKMYTKEEVDAMDAYIKAKTSNE